MRQSGESLLAVRARVNARWPCASSGRFTREAYSPTAGRKLLLAGVGPRWVLFWPGAKPISRCLHQHAGNQCIGFGSGLRLLMFAAGLPAVTCILLFTPALRATRIEPGAAMKASGRG